jgi:hypothetical protein
MRRACLSPLISMLLLFSTLSFGQAWSGILSSARAADWTQAGLPGDAIPSGSWAQCGSTINGYGSSGSPASPSTINSQISGCANNTYVLLSGTFYINGSVNLKSNVELRLANNTVIHSIGSGGFNCSGYPGVVCITGSNTFGTVCTSSPNLVWPCPAANINTGGYSHEANWTGNYSQGTSTITLDSVSGLTTNLTPIVLDQCDVGFSGNTGDDACGAPSSGNAGAITAASVWPSSGGSGYAVGDTGTINPANSGFLGEVYGSGTATYQVTSVSGGAVTGFTVTHGGYGYTFTQSPSSFWQTGGTPTASTSGGGSGFKVQITGIGSYDNGAIFDCGIIMVCEYENASNTSRSARSQTEVAIATAISGSGPYTVTLDHPVYHANWASGQGPKAWWGSATITNAGVNCVGQCEFDQSGITGSACGSNAGCANVVAINTANKVWVTGISSRLANYFHVNVWVATHFLVSNSYFYETANRSDESYGIGCTAFCGNALFENNVIQGIVDPTNPNGGCAGCVFAYNFALNMDYAGCLTCLLSSNPMHSAASDYILEEGNVGATIHLDSVHGPHFLNTLFRNYMNGIEANEGTITSNATVPAIIGIFSRYNNLIGNVLGTAGYHNLYQCVPASSTTQYCNGNTATFTNIYALGWADDAGSQADNQDVPQTPNDPTTASSLMRWGNYDVVSGSPQFNNSEVPTNDANYPNSVPSSLSLPVSFYNGVNAPHSNCGTGLSFWKNPTTGSCPPYPSIGPDVSNGDIGMCTSGTYKWSRALGSSQCGGGSFSASTNGGFGNSNPAMRCYLNQMGGTPDGTGSMLSFNASACYAADTSTSTGPNPPTGLTASVQ